MTDRRAGADLVHLVFTPIPGRSRMSTWLRVSPDEKWLAVSRDQRLWLYELPSGREVYVPHLTKAYALTALGETDRALTELERAYDDRNAFLVYQVHAPAFDRLKNEPRWKAIAARLHRTAPRVDWTPD